MKQKPLLFLLTIFMLAQPHALPGQAHPILQSVESSTCRILTELKDSMIMISGIYRHAGTERVQLVYELHTRRELPAGSIAQQSQSGEFLAIPGEENRLAGTELNIQPGAKLEITLSISDTAGLVCSDVYNSVPDVINKLTPLIDRLTQTSNEYQEAGIELEIGDLIIDRTVSKIGHDFYDMFFNAFQAPPDAPQYLIEVEELPSIGLGSRIRMNINDRELTNMNVHPRYDYMEQLVHQTVAMVQGYLVNYGAIMKQMEGVDQKGTGIY